MFELHHLTAQEQWDWLHRGDITPRELVDHYLERIARLDGELGAFVTVTPDAARHRADALADTDPRTGALWGLPFADKDLSRRAGVPTGFGSRLMADFVPDESDELPLALHTAGGISLGKTNTPEFGMPSYTESLVAPPARTPWDPRLGAGGSSGGAAVAVAAGLLPLAPAPTAVGPSGSPRPRRDSSGSSRHVDSCRRHRCRLARRTPGRGADRAHGRRRRDAARRHDR
jgi:amidase